MHSLVMLVGEKRITLDQLGTLILRESIREMNALHFCGPSFQINSIDVSK